MAHVAAFILLASFFIQCSYLHTLQAPIEADVGDVAYGSIDVYDSKLHLNWQGKLPHDSPMGWPKDMLIQNQVKNYY